MEIMHGENYQDQITPEMTSGFMYVAYTMQCIVEYLEAHAKKGNK